jgi:hypothetical protein
LCQKRHFFAKIFGKNISKITTSVPGGRVTGLGEYFAQWQDCQIFLGTTYQNGKKYAKLPPNIPNGHNIYQMALNRTHFIKYTNIFHCKTLKNLPKLGFLV